MILHPWTLMRMNKACIRIWKSFSLQSGYNRCQLKQGKQKCLIRASVSLSLSLYLGLALSRLIIDQSLQAELWYNHGNRLERVSVSVQGGPCKYLKYLIHTHTHTMDGPQLVASAPVKSSFFVTSIIAMNQKPNAVLNFLS